MAEAIRQFSERVNQAFDRIHTTTDKLVADSLWLKEQITILQNTAGTITPEDQGLLDGIEARANTIHAALEALDASTEDPPVPQP